MSEQRNICYCGAYGGGAHTPSARCDGSREPDSALEGLITAPENPTLDDLIAFYSEGNFRSGVRVRVPYRATREALERLRTDDLLAIIRDARYFVSEFYPQRAEAQRDQEAMLARIDAALPPPPHIELCDDPLCCQLKGHSGPHDDMPF